MEFTTALRTGAELSDEVRREAANEIEWLRKQRKELEQKCFDLREALQDARELAVGWCHSQGNSQELFDKYIKPIDAALSKARGIDTTETD